jgi:hypothetical protein
VKKSESAMCDFVLPDALTEIDALLLADVDPDMPRSKLSALVAHVRRILFRAMDEAA